VIVAALAATLRHRHVGRAHAEVARIARCALVELELDGQVAAFPEDAGSGSRSVRTCLQEPGQTRETLISAALGKDVRLACTQDRITGDDFPTKVFLPGLRRSGTIARSLRPAEADPGMSKSLIMPKNLLAADIGAALGASRAMASTSRATVRDLVGGPPPARDRHAGGEEVKRGKWTFAHLPAIPSRFALNPSRRTRPAQGPAQLIKRKT